MKDRDIHQVISTINKMYKTVSVRKAEYIPSSKDRAVPTGIEELDNALGVGGIPKGSIVEILGPVSVGKTSLALHLARQYQNNGMSVLYIDSEKSLTREQIEQWRIDGDRFFVLDADNLEEALDACAIASLSFGAIIIDSIAELPAKVQRDGKIGDKNSGARTKILSDAFPVLVPLLSKNECTLIFTNQIRQKLGVIFGNPEISTGGMAPKYYATLRIDLRVQEIIRNNGEIAGIRIRAKTVKNKIAVPYKEATFDILFGNGIKTN